MNNQQINQAIAEACGWIKTIIPAHEAESFVGLEHFPERIEWRRENSKEAVLVLPNYCEDLNACHEFERAMIGHELSFDYSLWLNEVCDASQYPDFHATAHQRAEAFLRTKGLWRG